MQKPTFLVICLYCNPKIERHSKSTSGHPKFGGAKHLGLVGQSVAALACRRRSNGTLRLHLSRPPAFSAAPRRPADRVVVRTRCRYARLLRSSGARSPPSRFFFRLYPECRWPTSRMGGTGCLRRRVADIGFSTRWLLLDPQPAIFARRSVPSAAFSSGRWFLRRDPFPALRIAGFR